MIYGLEGDDCIAPQVDLSADFISCGPGFDTVDPSVSTSPNFPAILQYEPEPNVIVDDCEQVFPAP